MLGLRVYVLLVGVLASQIWFVRSQEGGPSVLPYNTPDTCSSGTEFFQTGNLSCVQCGQNQVTAQDGLSVQA